MEGEFNVFHTGLHNALYSVDFKRFDWIYISTGVGARRSKYVHYTKHGCTVLNCIAMICTELDSLHYTSLDCTVLDCTLL